MRADVFNIIHWNCCLIVPSNTAESDIQGILKLCRQELHPVIILEDVFSHLFEIGLALGSGQRIRIVIKRITFRCALFHEAKR